MPTATLTGYLDPQTGTLSLTGHSGWEPAMTQAIIQDTILAIVAIVIFAILWRVLRVFVHLALAILIVTSLPVILHGQIPGWLSTTAGAILPWVQQLGQQAWQALQSLLRSAGISSTF